MHPTPAPPVPDSPAALVHLWATAPAPTPPKPRTGEAVALWLANLPQRPAWAYHCRSKARTCFEFARAALDGRLPALDSAPPSKALRVAATYARAGHRWFGRRWLPADAAATRLRLLGLA